MTASPDDQDPKKAPKPEEETSTGKERASEPEAEGGVTDAEREAEIHAALDALLGRDEPAVEGAADRPKLQLDKTGALADRPKLQPKRPYARPGQTPGPEGMVSGIGASVGAATPPRKATLPPPIGSARPPGWLDETPATTKPDDEVVIPAGSFLYGEEQEPREGVAFRIDRYPVTNEAYDAFVRATGHRPPLYWPDGQLPEDLARHPVVGIDYYDALAYAQWKGKDLPYEDEWERAARGKDGRTYPWGNDPELGQANTARIGHKVTVPVGWYELNASPDGMRDAVGNVWEITHSPAPGGGIVVRGGSWYDFVLYAKTWFRFASRPEARNGTIGFRCVRRSEGEGRPDAPREVDPAEALEAIEHRRGPQPSIDRSVFSPEKRDLVPDYRRLRSLMSEREAEESQARDAALMGRMPAATEQPRRAPVRATPPPPIGASRPPAEPEAKKPAPPPAPKPSPKSSPTSPPKPKLPAKPKSPPTPEPRPPAPRKPQPKPPTAPAPAPARKPAPTPTPTPTPTPATRAAVGAGAEAREGSLDRASLRHATDLATRGAVGSSEEKDLPAEPEMPLGYWIAVGSGIALVSTLLILLVTGALSRDGGEPAPPGPRGEVGGQDGPGTGPGPVATPTEPPLPPGPQPTLPDVPGDDPRDRDAPTWIDGLDPAQVPAVEDGVWLLVFSEAPIAERRLTVRTANQVHRKMRDLGARLAVVLPREAFVGDDGRLLPLDARRARLHALGASSDVTVFLDPPVGPPLGGALRARFGVVESQAAIVLVDGRLEHRTAPIRGGFQLRALEPLAVRASDIRPR